MSRRRRNQNGSSSMDEIARKGEKWYERINERTNLEEEYWGAFIVIDVDTGKYVVHGDMRVACREFRKKHPNARSLLKGVGVSISV